jgi:hypothetical protein
MLVTRHRDSPFTMSVRLPLFHQTHHNHMASKELSDPANILPRDSTGSYLHLKLKRFANFCELSTTSARKTWHDNPHDAAVSLAANGRASCRQCHGKIDKQELRYQLLLQCHKGCKNSAFFHSDCIWKYPETKKITEITEFFGLEHLPKDTISKVKNDFVLFIKSQQDDGALVPRTKKRPLKDTDFTSACEERKVYSK